MEIEGIPRRHSRNINGPLSPATKPSGPSELGVVVVMGKTVLSRQPYDEFSWGAWDPSPLD